MSQENVEVVRSIYADWVRGDYSGTEWQRDDTEFVMADGPNPGRWVGADGIGEGWGDFLGAWEDFRQAADENRDLDDERVLVLFHFSGRGKRSGLEVERMGSQAAGLFHVRGGKVTKVVLYFDRSAALEAVGLTDQAMSQENVKLVRQLYRVEPGELPDAGVEVQHVVRVADGKGTSMRAYRHRAEALEAGGLAG